MSQHSSHFIMHNMPSPSPAQPSPCPAPTRALRSLSLFPATNISQIKSPPPRPARGNITKSHSLGSFLRLGMERLTWLSGTQTPGVLLHMWDCPYNTGGNREEREITNGNILRTKCVSLASLYTSATNYQLNIANLDWACHKTIISH